jgi:hypothetical protein
MTSPYVVAEVVRNLPRVLPPAEQDWPRLRASLLGVRDVWTIDRPAVFGPAKDRPILFTAAAWAEVLLTLDHRDFAPLMEAGFYGLDVVTPGNFLVRERAAGRLK